MVISSYSLLVCVFVCVCGYALNLKPFISLMEVYSDKIVSDKKIFKKYY